jgi:hypothetical protein
MALHLLQFDCLLFPAFLLRCGPRIVALKSCFYLDFQFLLMAFPMFEQRPRIQWFPIRLTTYMQAHHAGALLSLASRERERWKTAVGFE